MSEEYIFLNNKLVPKPKAFASVADPGFLYGQGLFETLRAYNAVPFALKEHLKRLFSSLSILGMKLKISPKEIQQAVYSTLKANQLKEAYIRITVWQAKKRVDLSVIAKSYSPYSLSIYQKGFQAIISSFRQNENSVLSTVKSTSYLLNILARRESQKKGFEEAILLNSRGLVCEGSRTNIFLIKSKKLFTPDLKQGCLAGITRQIVLGLARKNKIKIQEKKISKEELMNSDEAFLTNSLIEVMPLTRIDNQRIGKGASGEITKLLHKQYHDLVYPPSSAEAKRKSCLAKARLRRDFAEGQARNLPADNPRCFVLRSKTAGV